MGASDWVYIDVAMVQKLTDKAVLVDLEDGESLWLPLSQIEASDVDKLAIGDTDVTLAITSWIANQKGLE